MGSSTALLSALRLAATVRWTFSPKHMLIQDPAIS